MSPRAAVHAWLPGGRQHNRTKMGHAHDEGCAACREQARTRRYRERRDSGAVNDDRVARAEAGRQREIKQLTRAQAAEMRREARWGPRVIPERFGPERTSTVSLTELMYSDDEGCFEGFPHRTWGEMIAYA